MKCYRSILVCLLAYANTCLYICRANMSVAVVWMWPIAKPGHEEAPLALSAFYFGYPLCQVIAGHFATLLGGKKLLCISVFLYCTFTLLTVPTYYLTGGPEGHVWGVFLCRMLTGLFEGFNYPSQARLITEWTPKDEVSSGWSWSLLGQSAGTILVASVGAIVGGALGWEYIFYLSTAMGFVWLVVFMVFGSSTPEESRFISAAELKYIQENRNGAKNGKENLVARDVSGRILSMDGRTVSRSRRNNAEELQNRPMEQMVTSSAVVPLVSADDQHPASPASNRSTSSTLNEIPKLVPWKAIFTNPAFLSVACVQFSHNWAFYLLLSVIPSFYKERFNVDYGEMGFLSVMPWIWLTLLSLLVGPFGDFTIKKCREWKNTDDEDNKVKTVVRRAFTLASEAIQAVSLILLASCYSEMWCGVLTSVGVAASGFVYAGFYAGFTELSPKYSSYLVGISNGFAGLPGIFGNLSVSAFNGNWSAVFIFAAGLQMVGVLPMLFLTEFKDQNLDGDIELRTDSSSTENTAPETITQSRPLEKFIQLDDIDTSTQASVHLNNSISTQQESITSSVSTQL